MPQYEEIWVSDEFIDLCEAQLSILFHSFFVQESIVYLTNSHHQNPKLIPVVVYPQSSVSDPSNLLPAFSNTLVYEQVSYFLEESNDGALTHENKKNYDRDRDQEENQNPHQIVLPLMYQDIVFGLLAIKRQQKPWHSHEIIEIKEIAQTIAIARFMEQKQELFKDKYEQNQKIQGLKNETLDDFLHQLKNPLTAIRTFAKLLLRSIVEDEPNYNTSKSILIQSDRLQDLIADFSDQWQEDEENKNLTVTATESTSFFLTEQIESVCKLNFIEILNPIVDTIKVIALEKNIQVINNITSPSLFVISNQKALTEILTNLLENAVKYTPKNGFIAIDMNLELAEHLAIEIADTGYGIPTEDQEHIFERHYRGQQEDGDIQGTGLGLAIVKQLCDQVDIKIILESPYQWRPNQLDRGTKFTIFIPSLS